MTTPLSRYRLEAKADFPDPATEPDPTDLSQDPNEDGLEWAGDLYEEGDESDPAEAFAVFRGDGDVHAWLDRADDGTLTGWVRDSDGSVYRYSDVDAWAIDVRDAGMARTDDAEGLDSGDPETDPEADPEEGPEEGDGDLFDKDMAGDELPDDEGATEDDAEDPDGDSDPEADTDKDGDGEPDPDKDGDDDTDPEGDDDEDFFAKQKRKGEGKSFGIEFRPFTGQR